MKETLYISTWIKRFLLEYLISTKNLSKNTQLSYRDTFRLLLPFAANKIKKAIDKWCRQVQMVPFKRGKGTVITYLEKPEMDALFTDDYAKEQRTAKFG